MNPLLEAAHEVTEVCLKRSLRYCFIGGLAVLRWGEPRLTRDIDLTVIAGFGAEEPVVDALLNGLAARRCGATPDPACPAGSAVRLARTNQ